MYFSHSGDLGDIIYALPTIRACGGGELWLFNYPGRTTHQMTKERAERLRRLIEHQDYITTFGFTEQPTDTSINGFRDHKRQGNTSDKHLSTMGLDWRHRTTAWLNVPEAIKTHRVVINRTPRYQSQWFDWGAVCDKYQGNIGFIGLYDEWIDFCNTFKKSIPRIPANDLMEVAQAIAGCDIYLGNATCSTAIAEGLKHPKMIVEVTEQTDSDVRFNRYGVSYVQDGKIELPEL
jgi:hypothetical protein